nr:aspartate--trna ligase, mitochondrial [Quercus suber]
MVEHGLDVVYAHCFELEGHGERRRRIGIEKFGQVSEVGGRKEATLNHNRPVSTNVTFSMGSRQLLSSPSRSSLPLSHLPLAETLMLSRIRSGSASLRPASSWPRPHSVLQAFDIAVIAGFTRRCNSDLANVGITKPVTQRIIPRVRHSNAAAAGQRSGKQPQSRGLHSARTDQPTQSNANEVLQRFKQFLTLPPASVSHSALFADPHEWVGKQITVHGYIASHRIANKNISFLQLRSPQVLERASLQCTLLSELEASRVAQVLPVNSPVAIVGTLQERRSKLRKPDASLAELSANDMIELSVDSLTPLNSFPNDIVMKPETVFPPQQRHLQIRNSEDLQQSLRFRSNIAQRVRFHLQDKQDFIEIETPLLFKSTPEGAREFLVPTRVQGMAYALPQSPQQYKQILMASGVARYMQLAKCFRDEDLRADRQPEFTQIDLEMAFASAKDVMTVVESLIQDLWRHMDPEHSQLSLPFACMAYDVAMARYGSDKPDVRIGCEIKRVEWLLPVDLINKIGPLQDPIVEAMNLPLSRLDDPNKTRKFINDFMASPAAETFLQNQDGQPGLFIFDSGKPLQGLQVLGFEAAEQIEEMLDLADGDLVVLQARRNEPFAGGSTPIGNLRLALHKAAVEQGLFSPPEGFEFLWITDFPLFSPSSDKASEPGQGGTAGLSSTHHPFTAPKTAADIDLLLTDPLAVKGDHYDLVVNGVELGGGSRRIHVAEMQELVMRNVLGMNDERMKDFEHLLEVLRAGCPPHAGIALGFDRLIAMMLGKDSVRDVIAFPKSGKGEDLLVKSPTKMVQSQLDTYHLTIRK